MGCGMGSASSVVGGCFPWISPVYYNSSFFTLRWQDRESGLIPLFYLRQVKGCIDALSIVPGSCACSFFLKILRTDRQMLF